MFRDPRGGDPFDPTRTRGRESVCCDGEGMHAATRGTGSGCAQWRRGGTPDYVSHTLRSAWTRTVERGRGTSRTTPRVCGEKAMRWTTASDRGMTAWSDRGSIRDGGASSRVGVSGVCGRSTTQRQASGSPQQQVSGSQHACPASSWAVGGEASVRGASNDWSATTHATSHVHSAATRGGMSRKFGIGRQVIAGNSVRE